jgi:hypothetical protein
MPPSLIQMKTEFPTTQDHKLFLKYLKKRTTKIDKIMHKTNKTLPTFN